MVWFEEEEGFTALGCSYLLVSDFGLCYGIRTYCGNRILDYGTVRPGVRY